MVEFVHTLSCGISCHFTSKSLLQSGRSRFFSGGAGCRSCRDRDFAAGRGRSNTCGTCGVESLPFTVWVLSKDGGYRDTRNANQTWLADAGKSPKWPCAWENLYKYVIFYCHAWLAEGTPKIQWLIMILQNFEVHPIAGQSRLTKPTRQCLF